MDTQNEHSRIKNDVLGDIQEGANTAKLRRRFLKNLVLLVIIISIANFFLVTFFAKIMHLNYRYWQWSAEMLATLFIILPAGSFVLSALLSLVPTKRKTYKQKLIPSALIILLCVQAFLLIVLALNYLNLGLTR